MAASACGAVRDFACRLFIFHELPVATIDGEAYVIIMLVALHCSSQRLAAACSPVLQQQRTLQVNSSAEVVDRNGAARGRSSGQIGWGHTRE